MNFSLIRTLGYCIGGIWTAWGGRERIEAKQLKNLRRLIQTARNKSPYFNKLYTHLPETNLIKLNDLPVTSKVDLMDKFDNWLTDRSLTLAQARKHMDSMDNLGVPIGEYAVFRTSGSSGEPAVIVIPSSVLEFIFGLSLARLSKKQLQIERKIKKAGTNVIITGGNGHFAGAGLHKLMHFLAPRLAEKITFIPAEQPIGKTVKQLNGMGQIASIMIYPSMLAILTREKEAGRLTIEPKLFKVAGETFTSELRGRVEKVFPSLEYGIVDIYACTECLFMAFKCDCGRQHVLEDWVILEAVDENKQPVPDGELSTTALITVLYNHVQPFIRYDIGDRLRFYREPCACGSPFRSFQIEGRQATVVRVGNVTLSPLAFDLEHESAQRVQLVQTSEFVFEVRAELLNPDNPDQVFEQIIQSISAVFSKNGLVDVKVGKSDAPPLLTASGKFHEVIPLK
ncbi:MAG: phenylacetate--CoA ligase family protein [Gammaproteobacteria bacterium]|nr:phenylacetate--CoA ligase family protein [Gammaproteobacteria bacterium]NIN62911.1 phenylacetate--CoA ligase family protein [Gammaproteobacteria bacterium]NIO63892.1 phenylacetate--CoA ligase family protein [Gammaproteobacteria bacterium]NIP50270.1 phenylacetate--CoA ligase family protein [Gammaproteobacteria bacterium]NIQ12490.1 phenylacetate--CoA ligase family protein [Gammaproteobacteria bacterium]